jgi:dTDP-4-amino-4,6-dideoxygalactose transaminase
MIPIIDLGREYADISAEANPAVQRVLLSGTYILGPESTAFEQELAAYSQVKDAIGVNSGTDAILLALRALDIGPGDEVIVPAMTFIATAEPVAQLGAVPVLVDIDPVTYTMNPALLEKKITAKTRAIIVVHFYGQSADLKPILALANSRKIPVIEDMAQALGAEYDGRKVGSFGALSCLSFFPTKNLGACGVMTSSPELAKRVRLLRNHGAFIKYQHEEIGYNTRLDEIQAAILRIKLRRLDAWNAQRREWADLYATLLKGVSVVCPAEAPGRKHIYHLYSIQSKRRDALRIALEKQGIATGLHYPAPLHLQAALKSLNGKHGDFPVSEQLAERTVSLPLYAQMTRPQVETVAAAVREFEQAPISA